MAEAATYPYPALRLHFTRLEERDQLRFVPRLEGETLETVYDVGVVGAALEIILEDVDRSGLLDGASRRRGRGLLRP